VATELADLAFTLKLAGNEPPMLTTLQQLQPGQTAIVSPNYWDLLAEVFMPPEIRQRTLSQALQQRVPTLDDTVRAGTLPQEAGIPITQLPRNWSDVLLFPFRRLADIVRKARAKKQSLPQTAWDIVSTTARSAYQAGDTIPSLLMEAVRRRKALMANNPDILSRSFRMDYSSVPEMVGLFNIAALPFFNYQYFAVRGLKQALRRNPERVYNTIVKPIERSTRITQADDEQGVSESPRFGFTERELYPVSATRGIPYSSILPMDPQFAEPFVSLSAWISRSPFTAIARPFVENRDNIPRLVDQLVKEFIPPSFTHLGYAILGEPQRGMKPALQHTRLERLLRAIGINVQPVDQMQMAKQQQRQAEQQRNEPLWNDPTSVSGIVRRVLDLLGW
jgi:hypothetical protein